MSGGTPTAPTDISGKASVVLTSNGDTLYYNSGRQRLPKGADGTVLTLASGLPSWATASSTPPTNMKYLQTIALGSPHHVLELTTGLADYDIVWIYYYLEKGTGNLIPEFNVYQTGGSLAGALGLGEERDGSSMGKTNGASTIPIESNSTGNNVSWGISILQNGNGEPNGSARYGGGQIEGQLSLAGTSNAPDANFRMTWKLSDTTQMIGFQFRNGSGSKTFATDSYASIFVGHDIS